ncbi:unnamed protein product, partial [Hapterophycus canaliculatus]
LRLGSIFTAAAKGKHPDPGTFYSVENAPDPLAASAPAAASGGAGTGSSSPPFAGHGGDSGRGGERGVSGGPAEGWREEGGGSRASVGEQGCGYPPPPPPP